MKEFIFRNKTFIVIVAATLLILFGGVFVFSKNSSTVAPSKQVSSNILISEDSHKSNPNASLNLVEFGDYRCPACAEYQPFIKKLLSDFPNQIDLIYRHYPLSVHKNAQISAYAAEAAAIQGKFWEMHYKLYETQSLWSNSDSPKDIFVSYADELGLNNTKFLEDIDSQGVKDIVKNGVSDGNLAGIGGTPTFFINGGEMPLVGSYEELKKIIEQELNTK